MTPQPPPPPPPPPCIFPCLTRWLHHQYRYSALPTVRTSRALAYHIQVLALVHAPYRNEVTCQASYPCHIRHRIASRRQTMPFLTQLQCVPCSSNRMRFGSHKPSWTCMALTPHVHDNITFIGRGRPERSLSHIIEHSCYHGLQLTASGSE